MARIIKQTLPREKYDGWRSYRGEYTEEPADPKGIFEASQILVKATGEEVLYFPVINVHRALLCEDDEVGSSVAFPEYEQYERSTLTARLPFPQEDQYVVIEARKGAEEDAITRYLVRPDLEVEA